jgi:hypothetical protein
MLSISRVRQAEPVEPRYPVVGFARRFSDWKTREIFAARVIALENLENAGEQTKADDEIRKMPIRSLDTSCAERAGF